LASNFAWNSTYAFAENCAIQFIDLDGTEISKPAFYQKNIGWTTAIDNVGSYAINNSEVDKKIAIKIQVNIRKILESKKGNNKG
jgi:hypothetical protein